MQSLAELKSIEVINLHIGDGLTFEQAEKAALTTIKYALSCGLYPYEKSKNQKAENFLINKLGYGKKDIGGNR